MKELVEVDLQGRVYGYPPMGNSREEMEGFRFWKTGYWKDALRGRPYHIRSASSIQCIVGCLLSLDSALYVIDLKRFRQLATGVSICSQPCQDAYSKTIGSITRTIPRFVCGSKLALKS